ncbi:MAG: ABC transporter permease [Caldilineaceae bacterium]
MSATTTLKPQAKPRDSRNLVGLMPIITLVVLMVIMTIGSRNFFSRSNLLGLLEQSSTLLVMGLGQTFVILLGSIDLTVAAVAAFVTIVVAMLIPVLGYWAFVVGALVGVFSGLVTGLIHTKARIPSFIATLGISGIWTGIAFVVSDATPITISNADIGYLEWVTGDTFGLPNTVLIAAFVLLITYVLESFTPFGRYVKAIGAGERATFVSGINIDRYKTLAFTLCGTLAGVSGILLATRMAGGSARMADGMQMKAIAIVVLGGTAISGGVGGVMRTLVGGLIVIVLDVGMVMIGINPWFRQAIYGAIIIIAVALTIDRQRITIIK